MTEIEIIYNKYRNGDPLSMEELKTGFNHFNTLATMLGELGPVFLIVSNETNRIARDFKSYLDYNECR